MKKAKSLRNNISDSSLNSLKDLEDLLITAAFTNVSNYQSGKDQKIDTLLIREARYILSGRAKRLVKAIQSSENSINPIDVDFEKTEKAKVLKKLLDQGLTYKELEIITGIPKSSIFDLVKNYSS
jgi:predicted transcriptional regulator